MIEAKLDKGRGPVATVLVQRGTLQSGRHPGGRRGMGPGTCCSSMITTKPWRAQAHRCQWKCSAFPAAPEAGDEFVVVESDARAREVTEYRARKRREQRQTGNVAPDARPVAARAAAKARSVCCRWSSRRTCRVRSKPFRARSTSSAPTKWRCRHCNPASAASPNPT